MSGLPPPPPPGPFGLQRQLRERLNAALRQGSVALIDIGSSKIACLIAEFDPQRIIGPNSNARQNLGGFGAVRVVGAGHNQSRGVSYGAISNMDDAVRAIRAAVSQAETNAGRRVFHALATLTGAYPRSIPVTGETAIERGLVEGEDVSRAIVVSLPPEDRGGFGEGRDVLHAIPVNWTVDSQQRVADPRGFSGKRLGVDIHILTVTDNAIRNVATTIARADLELAGVVSTPYASGLACLVEEELDDGAACIDMGGGATAVSMFLGRRLVFADLVRMGGEHVTLDIVRAFGVSQPDAERLKTLEGSAITVEGGSRSVVDLAGIQAIFDDGAAPTKSDLAAVIRPRVEETLELARERLEQAGFGYLPSRRIVLTGGASQLAGVVQAAQKVFGRQARVGRPLRLSGLPPEFSGPAFSGVAGLAAYAVKTPDEAWDSMAQAAIAAKGPLAEVWNWFKETW